MHKMVEFYQFPLCFAMEHIIIQRRNLTIYHFRPTYLMFHLSNVKIPSLTDDMLTYSAVEKPAV